MTADPTAPATSGSSAAATTSATTDRAHHRARPPTNGHADDDAPTAAGRDVDRTTTLNAVIKDPDLGHTITVPRASRATSGGPQVSPVGAEQLRDRRACWVASRPASATPRPSSRPCSSHRGNPKQTVAGHDRVQGACGAPSTSPRPRADRRGRRAGSSSRSTGARRLRLTLAFNRPAYAVSTTDKNIKAKTFTASERSPK